MAENQTILNDLTLLLDEFLLKTNLPKGSLIVLGCSTSEIGGGEIGKSSAQELGTEVVQTILEKLSPRGIYLAVQCCEHLNRALVIESEAASVRSLEPVWVVPATKAGGSAATAAYKLMRSPVVVERLKADAGIDIGDTFIGMHLKEVAVPFRLSRTTLGHAHITFAKTRPRYIGGPRAVYE